MPIEHHITPTPDLPMPPGGAMLNTLTGLMSQAQALIVGGVGLPGVQAIGQQIAGMGSQITTAGAEGSVDASGFASTITSLGSQLAGITNLAGASGIMSALTTNLGGLTNLLNPGGGQLAQIIHSHIIEMASGITHSAFQGQHLVQLLSSGLNLQSITKIAKTAPAILHNGNTLMSDLLQVSKGVTGASFGILSDRRLKKKIRKHEPVLERLLRLQVKRYLISLYNFDSGKKLKGSEVESLGLIAQELQALFPDLVRDGKYLSIDVDKLVMILLAGFIEHVIETRSELALIKADIKALKKKKRA